MRTIIAGSRSLGHQEVALAMMHCGWWPTVVVSGTASGVDRAGEAWAKQYVVPVERYPAKWTLYGKSAGPIRNRQMADNAEALVAVWDGTSKGTKDMIDAARAKGLRVYVWTPKGEL